MIYKFVDITYHCLPTLIAAVFILLRVEIRLRRIEKKLDIATANGDLNCKKNGYGSAHRIQGT